MTLEEYSTIYNLFNIKGVGNVNINKMLLANINHYKSNSFYESILKLLTEVQKRDFLDHFNRSILPEVIRGFPIEYVSILDDEYPIDLKIALSTNSPTVISTIGNRRLLDSKKVGFCGSRKASNKGLDITSDCVEQLVKQNVTIVSGYASGIDQQTHYTALLNNGSTIIVLPEGINNFRIKKELNSVWDWNRVLVISEFLPNAIWSSSRAMQRNNTIIGLSNLMILIEAGETGGSMEAGKKTLQLNKYLFAPVYEGIPESAIGNQILLNKGAFPLKKKATTMRANMDQVFTIIDQPKRDLLI
jgi:DNA processing protein